MYERMITTFKEVFSIAGNLIDDQRTKLSDESVRLSLVKA